MKTVLTTLAALAIVKVILSARQEQQPAQKIRWTSC
jgi:hypothetical protein